MVFYSLASTLDAAGSAYDRIAVLLQILFF
jgi:hypothetical protein